MGEPRRLAVSFSGGETSALMTRLIHQRWRTRYDEIVTIFANTGQENEETLRFVQRCDEHWGWGVVWVEAVVHPEAGAGTTHRVVDFETAHRGGDVFEPVIAKYGIPGPGFLHCTRELKAQPIKSYLRSIGWEAGSYDTAIGIRCDEVDRVERNWAAKRIVYPLIRPWPLRKIDVNEDARQQPFRLNLAGYESNCIGDYPLEARARVSSFTVSKKDVA